MLNITQQEKIKRFIADVTMSSVVKEVLRESFLKEKDGDIHMKASQMMAVNLLEDGFKELKKYSNQTEKEGKDRIQIAL